MRHDIRTAGTLIAFVLVGLLAACGGTVETAGPGDAGRDPEPTISSAELEGTEWVLVALNGDSPVEGTTLTLAFYPDNYLEGNAGCNYYGADYTIGGNDFQVAEIHKTDLDCDVPESILQQEKAFFEALAKAAAYRATADRLEFEDASGKTILAFARKQPPTVDPALQDTEWVLTALQGKGLLEGSHITLDLGAEGFGGFAGCNRYGGEYEAADDGILSIPVFAITEMDCHEPEGIMQQEVAYVQALQSAAAYRLADDRLEIQDAVGETILVFVRKEQFTMDPGDLMGTEWQLVSMNGSSPIEGSTITLAFHSEHRVHGHAGCRDYVATYEAEGDNLRFLFLGMIEADCPMPDALLEQEGQYTAILGWASDYRLGEGQLEILTARGEVVIFEPLPEDTQAALEGTSWVFVAFVQEKILEEEPVPLPMPAVRLAETAVTARFEGGTVKGSAGCNTYRGSYALDGPSITSGMLAVTEMACLDPAGVMEQEQRYLDFFANVTTYHVHYNQLWLETGDGRALVFTVQQG